MLVIDHVDILASLNVILNITTIIMLAIHIKRYRNDKRNTR